MISPRRPNKFAGCFGFSVLICVFAFFSDSGKCQDLRIWATGCTEKVRDQRRAILPHDNVWDSTSNTVRLSAVRGEHIPFQVVLTTGKSEVKGIQIELPGLRSGHHSIDGKAIKLFLVHLVNVYAATDDHGQQGRWPDALVPLSRPFDMRFFWHSQSINQRCVWVDIEVPREQAPGNYRGIVSVTSNQKEVGRVNVELTVHDVTMPSERHFPVHIGLYENHIARMHRLEQTSKEFQDTFTRYLKFFLDNRIDPRTSPGFQGRIRNGKYELSWTRPDLEQLFLENGRRQFFVSPVPDSMPRPVIGQPLNETYQNYVRQHVQQIIDHASANGWYDRLGFQVPVDEPNSLEEYASVRYWAEAIRTVDGKVPIAVTEQPSTENTDWGTLKESINAWIINGNYLFRDEDSIELRRKAGDQVLWYMSCDQLYPQPNFYIDRVAADPRMVPWITWRYRLHGILYWNAAYWEEVRNPWADPVTWKTIPCNLPAAGEGSLIYPGNMVQRYTGQENVPGPVGSMRLALLREGLEELELLQLLAATNGRAEADAIAESLCRSIRDFCRDPNQIDAARNRLIEEILKRTK